MNISYGWSLVNANALFANCPCIDLLDSKNKIGVQVTADNKSSKLNKTIQCLIDNELPEGFDSLRVFILKKKQNRYTVNVNCPGVEFEPSAHVLDFDDILRDASTTQNISLVKRLHEYVVSSVDIFPQYKKPKLPLHIPSTSWQDSALAFSSRTTKFVGREFELNQLSKFSFFGQCIFLVVGNRCRRERQK